MFARSVGEVKYGEVIGYQLIYKGKESLSLVYEVVIIVDVVDYVVYECPFSLFKFFHQASCSGDAYNVYVCCILIYTIIIPYHQNVNTGKHHDTGAQVTSYRSVDRETVVAAVLILYFFGHSMYIKR